MDDKLVLELLKSMKQVLEECHRALGGEHIPGLPSKIRKSIDLLKNVNAG
jgi:hypothetical protein